jgi:hypothetical protein
MSKATRIRCYDYVNHPYDKVCEALTSHSQEIFQRATRSAETRAGHVAAGLHVTIAGLEVGKEIEIVIKGHTDVESLSRKELTLQLEWKAASAPRFFPTMIADLHVYPLSSTETQLDFEGAYEPPLGIVGKALDAVAGRRIAEASVHHFVNEVADYLRKNVDR